MAARFNPADGSLDTTFGVNGLALTTGNQVNFASVDVALEPDGRIVVAESSRLVSPTNFALARFLATGPQIGSFTASPNPTTARSSVTLITSNLTDTNPGTTITQVTFYLDSNGDGTLGAGDTFLGYGTQTGPGTWAFTFSAVGLAPGTYTFIAQAEDSDGVFGDPFAVAVQVI
jgi:hypothetical protein